MQLMLDSIKNEVLTFIEHQRCESCNEGELIFTGLSLMSYPAQYEHACDHCEIKVSFDNCYPRLAYSQDGL